MRIPMTPASAFRRATPCHFHGELDGLPLSAVLFVPRSAKSATLARSRVGRSPGHQMIVPAEIVEELLSLVLRVKSLLDGFLALLGAATLVRRHRAGADSGALALMIAVALAGLTAALPLQLEDAWLTVA